MLPTELIAMVFESLPPSSLAVCAQCSTRFSQLAQPLLWRTVYADRVPLPVAKRIYATLRASPHLAAAVHHLDVTAVLRPGGAPMVVLDQLAVLPLLGHLRALSLHGAFRAQELLLLQLPPLAALQIRVTAQNAPFVARQTQLTALMHADAADAYDWDTAQLLGAGAVPLAAAALSMSVLVRMLACECESEPAPESEPRTHRRLAPGCYIRLLAAPPPEPAPDFRTLCRVFEALPPASPARIGLLHVGALCDYRIRVPFKTAFATTRIDAVRLALPAPLARLPLRRVTVLHPRPTAAAAECAACLSLDAILDLLRMCRGLHTVLVQRWPPAAPPLFDDLRIFADMLTQFSAVCNTLHTVVSPWGTKFAMLDGVWFDSGAFTPYEPDPFAAAAAVFGPAPTPTEQDTPAPPLPDGSSTQNVDAGIDCCWATPTSPPWRSARLS